MTLRAESNIVVVESPAVAAPAREREPEACCTPAVKIWIDLDNSPHVPFFMPIIKELEDRGFTVTLTARDAFQVSELVDLHGLACKRVGRHYGKHRVWKALGLIIRALQLLWIGAKERPDLALAHCSRAQAIAAKVLHIPVLWISDYEFAKGVPFLKIDWLMMPAIIPTGAVNFSPERLLKYAGIKEDVYVPTFRPDSSVRNELGIDKGKLVVTIRPPAEEAHYHCQRSDELFQAAMSYLSQQSGVQLIILPRNQAQAERLRGTWRTLFESGIAIIPAHAIDGLNLIWYSDLVISGGGTMNREAAALGVPVYSIFGGAIGAVDRYLADTGRLILLGTADEVRSKIKLVRREIKAEAEMDDRPALKAVVENILTVCRACAGPSAKQRASRA